MKRCKFLEFFGYRYIVNHRTKEIHRADSNDSRCRFQFMTQAILQKVSYNIKDYRSKKN